MCYLLPATQVPKHNASRAIHVLLSPGCRTREQLVLQQAMRKRSRSNAESIVPGFHDLSFMTSALPGEAACVIEGLAPDQGEPRVYMRSRRRYLSGPLVTQPNKGGKKAALLACVACK